MLDLVCFVESVLAAQSATAAVWLVLCGLVKHTRAPPNKGTRVKAS